MEFWRNTLRATQCSDAVPGLLTALCCRPANLLMLRCGPSKRPFVRRAAFCRLKRQSADKVAALVGKLKVSNHTLPCCGLFLIVDFSSVCESSGQRGA